MSSFEELNKKRKSLKDREKVTFKSAKDITNSLEEKSAGVLALAAKEFLVKREQFMEKSQDFCIFINQRGLTRNSMESDFYNVASLAFKSAESIIMMLAEESSKIDGLTEGVITEQDGKIERSNLGRVSGGSHSPWAKHKHIILPVLERYCSDENKSKKRNDPTKLQGKLAIKEIESQINTGERIQDSTFYYWLKRFNESPEKMFNK